MSNYIILDTNIVLLDATNIYTLGSEDTIIVLPSIAVNELDSKKSGFAEINFQAREFGRLITKAKQLSSIETEDLYVSRFELYGTEIHIVTHSSYPDYSNEPVNIVNDRKIIETAYQYKNIYKDSVVQFMSNDVMARITANLFGVDITALVEVDRTSFEFTKEVTLEQDVFGYIHKKPIESIYPKHKQEHYNYKFMCSYSGHIKLCTLENGLINVIGKETDKTLSHQSIAPINAQQKMLSSAIRENSNKLIIVDSKTGSGKTAMALSNSLWLIKRNNPYEGIVYVRASVNDVDSIEEVGFLPGDAAEKNRHYFNPLYDTLDFIVRNNNKSSRLKGPDFEEFVVNAIEDMLVAYNITMTTGLGMRGRTFRNSIIIIDEVQNNSKKGLQTLLTRVGENCKVIVIGSQNQIDNAYINKYNNGLSVLLDAASKPNDVGLYAIKLNKTVRSDLAEFIEDIFVERK